MQSPENENTSRYEELVKKLEQFYIGINVFQINDETRGIFKVTCAWNYTEVEISTSTDTSTSPSDPSYMCDSGDLYQSFEPSDEEEETQFPDQDEEYVPEINEEQNTEEQETDIPQDDGPAVNTTRYCDPSVEIRRFFLPQSQRPREPDLDPSSKSMSMLCYKMVSVLEQGIFFFILTRNDFFP